jgi:hypothetical protein
VNYQERLDELRKELTDPGGRFEGDIAYELLGVGEELLKELKTLRSQVATLDPFNVLRRHNLYGSPAYKELAERWEKAGKRT